MFIKPRTNSEKKIEAKLVDLVKAKGGRCLKFVSPGTRGVPDRLILLPGAIALFVETKSLGDSPEPLQLYWHRELRKLGFRVDVIDTLQKAIDYVSSL